MHNGTYTIENRETGEHRTFLVRTQQPEAKFAPGKRVIALLNGRDNEDDFLAFGFVEETGIAVWKSKKGTAKLSHYEYFADMVRVLCFKAPSAFGKTYQQYDVLESRRCIRCNRKLSTPESIRAGIGPECAGKM